MQRFNKAILVLGAFCYNTSLLPFLLNHFAPTRQNLQSPHSCHLSLLAALANTSGPPSSMRRALNIGLSNPSTVLLVSSTSAPGYPTPSYDSIQSPFSWAPNLSFFPPWIQCNNLFSYLPSSLLTICRA